MPPTIRYHLDEHVDPVIADGLRRRGIDVTTTVEAGLRSAIDEEHVRFARTQQRVIVSSDRDFLVLAHRGTVHAGIVFYRQGRYTAGEMIRRLVRLWEQRTPEEMQNHVEFL
jgi:predicted nuclease of predicted toxin-antitoxin system